MANNGKHSSGDERRPAASLEELLDSADVLRMLKICNRTLVRWRKLGKIPFVKVGGKHYYRLSEICSRKP